MTSLSDLPPMTYEDRMLFGAERAKDVVFDAIRGLWRKRQAEGLTQRELAERMGRDEGYVSRKLRGPGNWTLKTAGEFSEALDGELNVSVNPIEEPPLSPLNYSAYIGYGPGQTAFQSAPAEELPMTSAMMATVMMSTDDVSLAPVTTFKVSTK